MSSSSGFSRCEYQICGRIPLANTIEDTQQVVCQLSLDESLRVLVCTLEAVIYASLLSCPSDNGIIVGTSGCEE